jgi:hypothetical protein
MSIGSLTVELPRTGSVEVSSPCPNHVAARLSEQLRQLDDQDRLAQIEQARRNREERLQLRAADREDRHPVICGSSWARASTPGPDAAAALSDRPWPPGNLLPDARWLNIMASMDL